ncbi:MAG: diacylglycerol kinase [Candidatus Liptonbacteria bacterium]|nr:diacylglycerol kinase [Candidatus Liptonbacteria bacterium]
MVPKNKISAKNLINSFRCAISGFWEVLIHEPSFRYMVVIAVFVLIAMFIFPTSRMEKVAVLTMIFAVLCLELINSVFERFLDFLQPEYDERVRIIKDAMSAIVLVVSLGAAIIGIIVFLPHFYNLFR